MKHCENCSGCGMYRGKPCKHCSKTGKMKTEEKAPAKKESKKHDSKI